MVLREGATHYEPVSWDEAFSIIANALSALETPDEAIFYTSGRTSNEAAYLYQLFVRRLGTNNLPDCSNMCHESSGTGLGEAIGIGKGTVTLEDFDHAELIYVIGQNPGTNHPRMLSALERAKRRGATIVSVNPLREAALVKFKNPQHTDGWIGSGTTITDHYVPVRVGGDIALLKGIMKCVVELDDQDAGDAVDHAFVEEYAEGFEDFREDLRSEDLERLVRLSGIEERIIRDLAKLTARSERIIVCWAMGLTQHEHGVANVQSCANLLMMRGALGKKGAGACPVRGHSNVQGDRTVGIWERPKPAFLDRLEQRYGFDAPRKHGYDTVGAIKAMADGEAKVFVAMGGNFLSAAPDTILTARGLMQCALTVHVSTKLNRAHVTPGKRALILPCLGRTELDVQESGQQFVTVENSMGVVHSSTGGLKPASEHLLSEPMIVARMAMAVHGEDPQMPWLDWATDYDLVRDEIEATVPGFTDYNRRVRRHGGFALPNGVRDERRFDTASGRAVFTVHAAPEHRLEPDQFLMMTLRSHDQYNTTIYSDDDRYRGIYGTRRVVMMHQQDIDEAGLLPGQLVDLVSHFKGERRIARRFVAVPYEIPRRTVGTYFPEANVLVPIDHVAKRSRTPASKSVVVSVHAHGSVDDLAST